MFVRLRLFRVLVLSDRSTKVLLTINFLSFFTSWSDENRTLMRVRLRLFRVLVSSDHSTKVLLTTHFLFLLLLSFFLLLWDDEILEC